MRRLPITDRRGGQPCETCGRPLVWRWSYAAGEVRRRYYACTRGHRFVHLGPLEDPRRMPTTQSSPGDLCPVCADGLLFVAGSRPWARESQRRRLVCDACAASFASFVARRSIRPRKSRR